MVVDVGFEQLAGVAAADGTFKVAGVPTLQGFFKITAALHEPCNVLLVGGPVTVSQLTAGGQTAVTLPPLVPDPGPPPPIIFASLPFPAWPGKAARCADTAAAGGLRGSVRRAAPTACMASAARTVAVPELPQ